jgi:hypothetical protein
MKHLFSYSVYQTPEDLCADIPSTFGDIRCDGFEILTSHEPADPCQFPNVVSAHLPYAADWISAWEGRPYEMGDMEAMYWMYGRSREEVVDTVKNMIRCAEPLKPAHGVIHACNIDLPDLKHRTYSRDPKDALSKFCEMMNCVVSGFPGNEPPYKLAFENLWWPGLRLQDDSDYRLMERKLEFENWGILLDTGHLMNTLPDIRTQQDGIEALLRIFDGYSQDLVDSIGAMHFHYSASWDYRSTFEEEDYDGGPACDFINDTFHHVTVLDQHLPFSDPGCRELVDRIQPELLIHELPGHGHDPLLDFRQQRSLFP